MWGWWWQWVSRAAPSRKGMLGGRARSPRLRNSSYAIEAATDKKRKAGLTQGRGSR